MIKEGKWTMSEEKYIRNYLLIKDETNLQEIIDLIRTEKSSDYLMVSLADGMRFYVIMDNDEFYKFIAELQGFDLNETEDY